MANEFDQIDIFNYQAPSPEEILQAGSPPQSTIEPTLPTPIKDYLLYDVLNPQGRQLLGFVEQELTNPLTYLGMGAPAKLARKGIETLGGTVTKFAPNINKPMQLFELQKTVDPKTLAIAELDFIKATNQNIKTAEDLHNRARMANEGFQAEITNIADDVGLEKLVDPETEIKTISSIEDKMLRGRNPNMIADPVRTRVFIDMPEEGDEFVRQISKKYKIIDEGEKLISQTGFQARNVNIAYELPNGETIIGEVQLISRPMHEASKKSHPYYQQQRVIRENLEKQGITEIPAEVIEKEKELIRVQQEIFAEARTKMNPAFEEKIVIRKRFGGYIGRGGSVSPMTPNVLSNSVLSSMVPLSKKSPTFRGFATSQSEPSTGMKKPLYDSELIGSTTAGPDSQEKYIVSTTGIIDEKLKNIYKPLEGNRKLI